MVRSKQHLCPKVYPTASPACQPRSFGGRQKGAVHATGPGGCSKSLRLRTDTPDFPGTVHELSPCSTDVEPPRPNETELPQRKATGYPSVLRHVALTALLVAGVALPSVADTLTFMWDPLPPGENPISYFVYVGPASGVYTNVYDVGSQTFLVFPNAVPGQEYFFAVAAYDITGVGPYSEISGFSNAPPSLVNPGNQVGAVGAATTLQLVGVDPEGEPVTYGATGLPPGLSLAPGTGLISGTASTGGTYSVTVSATDGLSSTPRSFTWTVGGGPEIVIESPTTAQTFSVSTSAVPMAGSASDDIGVSSIIWMNDRGGSGAAFGTTEWSFSAPLQLGANVITVMAENSEGLRGTTKLTVTYEDHTAPTVTITAPTSSPTYEISLGTISVAGTAGDDIGVLTVTWDNDNGSDGVATLAAGSWTRAGLPLQRGSNEITVTAWDAAGNSGSATLMVNRLNNAPSLNSPGDLSSAEGQTISLQLVANDLDADPLTFTKTGLPPGLTLNTSTGLISGTVAYTAAGVYSTTLRASDTYDTTSASFTWTVANTNRTPVVTNPGTQSSYQGVAVAGAIAANDPDGDPLTFSALNLPPGVAINPSTGALSGTPATVGVFTVVVSATDGSMSNEVSFAWSITSPLPRAATPISPSGSMATTTPTFSWTADGLEAYYLLSVSDASAASPTHVWYTPAEAGCPFGGTCTVAAPKSLASGLVSWMVLTWNPFGYGPWSTAMSAVVEVADATVPTPAVGAPGGPIATRTPTYNWNSIGSATWYQLSVTDALGAVREFWYSPAQACTASPCAVTPNILLAIGPAQWKVRAWRVSGAGAWSAPVSFEAADSVPGSATLVSPLAPVTSVTPSFTWNAVLGTSYYLLRVTDRDNVSVDRWYLPSAAGCPLGTGTCTVSPGIALKAGTANWRVLTWNGSGYGPWSATNQFLVEIADPAALTPTTVSPIGTLTSTNAMFRWTGVAGALSYRLAIRNNGGAPTYWWYTAVAAGCQAGAECGAVPSVTLSNGTADWRVQAWTPLGYGAWSPLVPLTVAIEAPLAPTLVSPNGPAGSRTPAFRWNGSANATLYFVRVYDVTGARIERWLSPAEAGCAGGGVCTLNAGVTLASGAGSWQVIAWNPTAYSPWSSTLVFLVP